jgi:chaperonin GroES
MAKRKPLPSTAASLPLSVSPSRPLQDFRPLNDRIAIERDPPERMIGSIVIPDTAQQKLARGTVVAVGPGAKDEDGERKPMDVKLGDRILFGKYAGDDVKIEDRDVTIIRECDVIGEILK